MFNKIKDILPFVVEKLTTKILLGISFLITRIKGIWWGVKIEKGCQFYGQLFFRRLPKGKISIGQRCVFRSNFLSNTIGIKQKCFLSVAKGGEINIGNDCGLSGTVISASKSISIGERVLCGANVTMTDSDRHPLNSQDRKNGKKSVATPIEIGNDVFIGMNSVILKGVIIGDNSVIAANSLVTKSVLTNTLVGGNPAKFIKDLV